ncbi:uncharacterized protein LOC144444237 [Glandiceps talaboti]
MAGYNMINAYGRRLRRGTTTSTELQDLIVQEILLRGGDPVTGDFSFYREVAEKFRFSDRGIRKIWERFVSCKPVKGNRGSYPKLKDGDIELIETLKRSQPSMTYRALKEKIAEYGDVTEDVSISTFGRAVRTRLSGGRWTFKKLTTVAYEKFTDENIAYCNEFVNFLHAEDPNKIQFFDEAGIKLSQDINPRYGHALRGERAVEIQRYMRSPAVTLHLMVGLEGLSYAKVIHHNTDTVQFIQFFEDASENVRPMTHRPVLEYGDFIVVDNHPTHHYEGGRYLGAWLDAMGIFLVYTPYYSPELNPAEFVFGKLKKTLSRPEYNALARTDLHLAVLQALREIKPSDVLGYYRSVGFLDINLQDYLPAE